MMNLKHPAATSSSGYTLIEVLIALAIFSIGMMALGALQSGSLMKTRDIMDKSQVWTLLEDQAETLKAMPFYANGNGINDDGDGDTDEIDELGQALDENGNPITPLLNSQGGDVFDQTGHAPPEYNGRFEVHWRIVDNEPIPAEPNVWSTSPPNSITVSKTITVAVTEPGGDPQTEALAMVEFVKTWAADGIQ